MRKTKQYNFSKLFVQYSYCEDNNSVVLMFTHTYTHTHTHTPWWTPFHRFERVVGWGCYWFALMEYCIYRLGFFGTDMVGNDEHLFLTWRYLSRNSGCLIFEIGSYCFLPITQGFCCCAFVFFYLINLQQCSWFGLVTTHWFSFLNLYPGRTSLITVKLPPSWNIYGESFLFL